MGDDDQELNTPDSSASPDGQDTGNAGADSSSDAKDEGQFDLLSVVRDAAQPDPASSADETESGSDSTDPASTTDTQGTSTEPDNENFSDVPFNAHPRFRKLVQERNQLRGDAEQYRQVQAFLNEHGLTERDASSALQLHALMKTDPHKAWEQLRPMAKDLLDRIGEVLPQDIQARVQRGEITRETGLEISRLRAKQSTSEAAQAHRQEIETQRQQQEAVRAVQSAVGAWEQAKQSDPDYAALSDDMQREVLWLHRAEGVPSTPEAARAQLDKAYKSVKERRAVKPQRQAKTPVTGGSGAGGNATPPPANVLDIVKAGGASG